MVAECVCVVFTSIFGLGGCCHRLSLRAWTVCVVKACDTMFLVVINACAYIYHGADLVDDVKAPNDSRVSSNAYTGETFSEIP